MKKERISNIKIYSDWKDDCRRLLAVDHNNRSVGSALLKFYSWPIPLYELTGLYVAENFRGRGYGSTLMAATEEYLQKKKKTGILSDAIMPNEPASGMYKRRGWVPIADGDFKYAFNVPRNISPESLHQFYLRRKERNIRKRQEQKAKENTLY